MKYIVVLGDGMADYPVDELGGKTPLQCARKPIIDDMAAYSQFGTAVTVPPGMAPGSDTANLSVLGYNPRDYYTGRSPFEALSMGLDMAENDISFRCNLVTLSADEPYTNKKMLDYCAGEISTPEAKELITGFHEYAGSAQISFFPGMSYRHIMMWRDSSFTGNLVPPHDIINQSIQEHLPGKHGHSYIQNIMEKSSAFFRDHPVNEARKKRGLPPANSVWIWGEGKKPALPGFYEKYGLKGAVISAVDLIKGLGLCAGLEVIEVEGATGNINTNFTGKARAAIDALTEDKDFIYIHLEAPDECGHRNEINNKVKSIELIDKMIVGPLRTALEERKTDYKMMVLPDHYTPLSLRTHTIDPVPFIIYDSRKRDTGRVAEIVYDEFMPADSGIVFPEGYLLMDYFINKD